jgi:undecaprenyl-diphosphatase
LHINSDQFGILIAGFIAAFVTGLFACQWMIKLVRNAQLKYFSYYCFLVGTAAIAHQVSL